jgi:hypothetical protein
MSKKIKISESQLKMIVERKHSYKSETKEEVFDEIDQIEDKDKEEIDVEETPINESVQKIKENFRRFL